VAILLWWQLERVKAIPRVNNREINRNGRTRTHTQTHTLRFVTSVQRNLLLLDPAWSGICTYHTVLRPFIPFRISELWYSLHLFIDWVPSVYRWLCVCKFIHLYSHILLVGARETRFLFLINWFSQLRFVTWTVHGYFLHNLSFGSRLVVIGFLLLALWLLILEVPGSNIGTEAVSPDRFL
jgi:hypothetical protein